jgi:hypothetical protein
MDGPESDAEILLASALVRTGPVARPTLVALAVALVLAVAATVAALPSCGGDDDDDRPPSSTAAPPTTSPEDATKAEVEAGYMAYREMADRLLQDPDPDDPEIEERTTGETKSQLTASLQALQDDGRAVRFGDQYQFKIVDVELLDAVTAIAKDCVVDDSQTIDARSGEVLSEGLATALFSVTMKLEDGAWLVSSTPDPDTVWEGVDGCAIE